MDLATVVSAIADSAGMASAGVVLAAAGVAVSVLDLAGVGAGPGRSVGGDPVGAGILTDTTPIRTAATMNTAHRTRLRPIQITGITIPTDRRTHCRSRTATTTIRWRRTSSHLHPGPQPATWPNPRRPFCSI
jgi:hypothetical protein